MHLVNSNYALLLLTILAQMQTQNLYLILSEKSPLAFAFLLNQLVHFRTPVNAFFFCKPTQGISIPFLFLLLQSPNRIARLRSRFLVFKLLSFPLCTSQSMYRALLCISFLWVLCIRREIRKSDVSGRKRKNNTTHKSKCVKVADALRDENVKRLFRCTAALFYGIKFMTRLLSTLRFRNTKLAHALRELRGSWMRR